MYHFTNQPHYHHNGYQNEHSAFANGRQESLLLSSHNQFNEIVTQNMINSQDEPQQTTTEPHPVKPDRIKKRSIIKTAVDTSNFSIEERLVAAVWVHERKRTRTSMSQIKQDFKQRFGREAPAKNTLLVWERKLFSTGSVCDAPRTGRPVNRCTRMEEVAASVRSAPALSLRARAAALRLPRTTLRTILRNDLPHTLKTKDCTKNKSIGKQQIKKKQKKIMKKSEGPSEEQWRAPPAASASESASVYPPPAPAPAPCAYAPHAHYLAHVHTHGYT